MITICSEKAVESHSATFLDAKAIIFRGRMVVAASERASTGQSLPSSIVCGAMVTHYSYADYLLKRFGAKTYKVVVSSGFTCPTRDGTIDSGGCAFCDVRGSSSFHGKQGRGAEVREQLDQRVAPIRKRFGAQKFLAYFQSYTNTYTDDMEELRELYEAAVQHSDISGICIGTRPDCVADPVLDLLEDLAKHTYVSLELGVQSFHNPTLEWLERGHDRACSIDAIERAKRRAPSVEVSAHLMFGNPPDLAETPREAARILSDLGVHGTKLHQLMVLENTKLAELYRQKPFATASLEDYTGIVCDFLEHLDPAIYVERLYATSSHPDECLAPAWSRDRWMPHNEMRRGLEMRACRQGSKRLALV